VNVKAREKRLFMRCPKCDFELPETSPECPRCGVILGKLKHGLRTEDEGDNGLSPQDHERFGLSGRGQGQWQNEQAEMLEIAESDIESAPEPRHLEKEDWIFLAVGLGITALILAVPLFRHIFRTLVTLVHEMGHMIFGWLFGYPSVPAFDIVYGGGVTIHTARSTLLLVVIYVLFGLAIYSLRKNLTAVIILVVLALVHLMFTLTTLHELAVLFMGHGTELVIAGVFFYRALSGSAVIHASERPLYAAIAFFIVFSDVSFAYGLMTSPFARAEYGDAKGGGHWMDFSQIAEDFLNMSLAGVAGFFLLCCLATLPMGFLAFRYQEYLRSALSRMLAR
jgi:hypothetical protein